MAEFHCDAMPGHAFDAMRDMRAAFAVVDEPRRKLKHRDAKLARGLEWRERIDEAAPHLVADLLRHLSVVERSPGAQAEGHLQIGRYRREIGLVIREQPERLDVHDEVIGRT